MHRLLCFLFLILCLIVSITGCEMDSTQHGCRIDNGVCTCAFGCKSEFRYPTRRDCQDAVKGRTNDTCSRVPCLNRGSCIQITQTPGYKCSCEGTGYWGNRCQRQCPDPHQSTQLSQYPHECIVI